MGVKDILYYLVTFLQGTKKATNDDLPIKASTHVHLYPHCNLTTAMCRITNPVPVQTRWALSSLRHDNPRSLSPLPHTCSPLHDVQRPEDMPFLEVVNSS